jgi:hypothetical protein
MDVGPGGVGVERLRLGVEPFMMETTATLAKSKVLSAALASVMGWLRGAWAGLEPGMENRGGSGRVWGRGMVMMTEMRSNPEDDASEGGGHGQRAGRKRRQDGLVYSKAVRPNLI